MIKSIVLGILCIIIIITTGCATMFTGTKQKITFNTIAEGTVYQNLSMIGKTNQVIKVRRKDLVKLYTVKAEGYHDKQFELDIRTNPAFYLNLPLCFAFGCGIIWAYVDVAYGAQLKTDKIINVEMVKK